MQEQHVILACGRLLGPHLAAVLASAESSTPTMIKRWCGLFVVSLATCVAYFAGQYLQRHGVSRAGLAVHAEYRKPDRPPAGVASIHLRVVVPAGLPVELVRRLHAVVSHCTVHNTLRQPPTVDIKIDAEPVLVPD